MVSLTAGDTYVVSLLTLNTEPSNASLLLYLAASLLLYLAAMQLQQLLYPSSRMAVICRPYHPRCPNARSPNPRHSSHPRPNPLSAPIIVACETLSWRRLSLTLILTAPPCAPGHDETPKHNPNPNSNSSTQQPLMSPGCNNTPSLTLTIIAAC